MGILVRFIRLLVSTTVSYGRKGVLAASASVHVSDIVLPASSWLEVAPTLASLDSRLLRSGSLRAVMAFPLHAPDQVTAKGGWVVVCLADQSVQAIRLGAPLCPIGRGQLSI